MTRNDDDQVRKEAARWFTRRLDPAVRESERQSFEQWREEDPRRAEAYEGTERLWVKLEILKQSERVRRAVADSSAQAGMLRPAHHPAVWRPIFFGLAASLVVVVALTLVYLNRDRKPTVQTFATAVGEQRTQGLADGSTLKLNTNTFVDVHMSRHRREITLRSGEVVFDVAKDATRPFVVSAGDGTVTAVGTQFEVRNDAGAVAVTLIEGRVQVARASRGEVEPLKPGQQARYSENGTGIVTRNVDVEALTSWMSGRLEFQGTPLEEAVAEANRYSARKLRIGDPTIRKVAVSGTFRTDDVDSMAAAFEAAFDLRIETSAKEVVIYGR